MRSPSPVLRCVSCRHWFHPAASAEKTQKTCSSGCRRLRRNALARRRRTRDVFAARDAERERQARCRRRDDGGSARATAPPGPMSRATLGPEMTAALEECLETVDTAFRRSRATLARALKRRLAESQADASTAAAARGPVGA